MLYYLKHVENDTLFYLTQQEQFYVGRKECDILIQNDQSISRKHALLKIQDDHVTIKDLGSKFNTTYDGDTLTPEVEVTLEPNKQVKFGVYNSVYILKKEDIVTTGTHLNPADKKKLNNVLNIIGAKYVDNWGPECTHLTVKAMSVTVKVLHALIDEKPIVVTEYWIQFSENVLKNLPPPDIKKYNNPPVGEALLKNVNFLKKVCRNLLFKDKLFIFPLEKNKVLMEDTIKKAAGQCISWEKNQTPLSNLFGSAKEILIIQFPNQEVTSSYSQLIQDVVKQGKRPIPLHEIALAIIKGSCEKNCNPDFDKAGTVFTKAIPILPTQTGVLAQSTESACFNQAITNSEIAEVPASFDVPLEHVLSVKKENVNLQSCSSTASVETVGESRMDQPITNKRKNVEPVDRTKEKKLKVEIQRMSAPSVSKENQLQKSEPFSAVDNSTPSHSKESETKLKVNPFACQKKKRTEAIEPFLETSIKRFKMEDTSSANVEPSKINVSSDAPSRSNFKNTTSISAEGKFGNDSNIFSSTRQNIELNTTVTTSRQSSRDFSSIPWLSKPTMTKEEAPEDVDPELRNYIELFRGKVVIEVVEPSKYLKLSRSNNDSTINESTSTKNFKKFKKVLPLHPQRTILRPNTSVQANVSEKS